MNIVEAMNKCCEDGGFDRCEECGVFGAGGECLEYLTRVMLEPCDSCKDINYYYVNDDNEIEKIKPRFCPECGRAL